MVRRAAQQNAMSGGGGNNMIMGGGENTGFSYVGGEMLKQVSVPTETLLGFANGALSGAIVSAAVSGVVSYAQHESRTGVGRVIMKNLTGKHLTPFLVGTTALGALGGLVRYSRATKHNEWSERHYAFLEQQETHAARIEKEREEEPAQGKSR